MANTSSRMLRLLSLLQTHRYWSGPELADRLEVSPRTVRRDVDRLRELGYPVDATRGIAGGYQLQAGGSLPPLLLEDDEAVAIAIGLQQATRGAVAGIEESSVRALSKLVQVMPKRLRRRVDALQAATVPAAWSGAPGTRSPDSDVEPETLMVLAQACRDDERARFAYTAREGEESSRSVEPHRLVTLGRRWYLVAYDLDRADWRSFRVDRISRPMTTGVRFRQRTLPDDDAAAFVHRGIRSMATTFDVQVTIALPAADVVAHVGQWGEVTEVTPTSCRLAMRADTLEWPVMILASFAAPVEIHSPPELVRDVARVAAVFAAASAGAAADPA